MVKKLLVSWNCYLKFQVSEYKLEVLKVWLGGFPGGAVVKNPPANAGDKGLGPGTGRSHMLGSN